MSEPTFIKSVEELKKAIRALIDVLGILKPVYWLLDKLEGK